MPDLPKFVKVGPYRYTVASDAETRLDIMGDRPDWAGCCDMRTLTIFVEPRDNQDAMAGTLLHEVIHACLQVTNQPDDDKNESYVERMTGMLLGVLRDNPDLVAFLTSDAVSSTD